ncbi:MAG: hypothetical protein P8N43_12685, partial [Alphaproteobacteria bacterium]|nr:hypothetical protein [Alphaproteobacteria bacterium]
MNEIDISALSNQRINWVTRHPLDLGEVLGAFRGSFGLNFRIIPRLSADPKKAGIFAEEGFLSGHDSRWIFERGGARGPEDCDPPSERDPRGGA